jgi:hypothetical protein
MPTIWTNHGSKFISDEAYEALADMGADIAEGRLTEDEATEIILRREGIIE